MSGRWTRRGGWAGWRCGGMELADGTRRRRCFVAATARLLGGDGGGTFDPRLAERRWRQLRRRGLGRSLVGAWRRRRRRPAAVGDDDDDGRR